MDNSPFFSIIVPIYNVERYLRECIESILSQTFTNFELILVDDGSPDSCPQICDEYAKKDNRVKVIHKNNGGLVSARKVGAGQAIGDYCICVDGDDYIVGNYLENARDIINENNPDIILFDYYQCNGNRLLEKHISFCEGIYTKQDIENTIFPCLIESFEGYYFSPNVWAKVFKRDLYCKEQCFVDERITIGEDAAVTKPCIYRAQNLFISHKIVYYYRYNEASMTKKRRSFPMEGPILLGQHFSDRIDMGKQDFVEQNYRNIVHNTFNVVCSLFNDKKKKKKSIIRQYLKNENISEAILKSKFKLFSKGFWAKYALRFRLLFICRMYNSRLLHSKVK